MCIRDRYKPGQVQIRQRNGHPNGPGQERVWKYQVGAERYEPSRSLPIQHVYCRFQR